MRLHVVLNVFLIVLTAAQVQGRTITADLAFARMDTCSALPTAYSYTGIYVSKFVMSLPHMPELADPMKATIELGDVDSLMLVWGKANEDEEGLSFYLVDDQAKTVSRLSFDHRERGGRESYIGEITIPGDEGPTPKMLLAIQYDPIQKMMMYRRLDFRLGAVTVGGRKVSVALASENELSFRRTGRGLILIDRDGDGHFRMGGSVDSLGGFQRAEAYGVGQPFPLGSAAYEIVSVSSDGHVLELTRTKSSMGLNVGLQVPDLSIETLEGEILNLGDLRGEIVVINSWQTACSPCIAEMPSLNDLVEKYASDRVIFLAVADNTPTELDGFLKNHKFDYRITLASDKTKEALGQVFPRHVIIDARGVVVYNQTGGSPRTGQELDTVIAALK